MTLTRMSLFGASGPLAGCHLDLEGALGRGLVVDLKRGVTDPEAVGELPLKVAPALVAIGPGAHDDVGREGGKARRDLPHVEVVDLDHVRFGGQRAADLLRIEPGR